MKIKTPKLADRALDWAVSEIENHAWSVYDHALYNDLKLPPRPSEYLRDSNFDAGFSPSTDWSQGGPIIEAAGIHLRKTGCEWQADWWDEKTTDFRSFYGPSMLVAGLRAFVFSKLGREVEVPDAPANSPR